MTAVWSGTYDPRVFDTIVARIPTDEPLPDVPTREDLLVEKGLSLLVFMGEARPDEAERMFYDVEKVHAAMLRLSSRVKNQEAHRSRANSMLARGKEILAARRAAARTGWVSQRVRPGDTLDGIAKRCGVKWSDIAAANKLKERELRVGEVLAIPLPPRQQ